MRIIVDCDPGLGKKFGSTDVDDGLALFFMLNQPDIYDIEGITITYGNTQAKNGYKLLENYLRLTNNLEIPHYLGASLKDDLGKLTEASKFLISKVKEYPHEIILLILGPLTNIATAMINYPEFLDNLKKVIFMGGMINPSPNQKVNYSEFNFRNDPIATKLFIEASTLTPRIGMGLDVCCKVVFKRSHYEKIKSHDGNISQYIAENILNWLNMSEGTASNGFYPFDTLVPIYLIRKDLFKIMNFHLKIDTDSIPGKILLINEIRDTSTLVSYCMDFASEQSKIDFMNILITGLTK
jgi:inosine-uridine nucleoside N-ribohydrolase